MSSIVMPRAAARSCIRWTSVAGGLLRLGFRASLETKRFRRANLNAESAAGTSIGVDPCFASHEGQPLSASTVERKEERATALRIPNSEMPCNTPQQQMQQLQM